MARDRANINTNLWADSDWRDLDDAEQRLYMLLMTHPSLSYAGVADWRPGRLAAMSRNGSRQTVELAAKGLQAQRFVFIDEDTEEILIRSFLRHDGLLKQPKLAVSMANAFGAVASREIQMVIVHELKRLHSEHPEWKAFEVAQVKVLLKLEGKDMADFTPGFTPALTLPFTAEPAQAQALPTSTATTTATSSKEDSSSSEISDEIPRPDVDELLDLLDTCLTNNGSKKPSRNKKNRDAARLLLDLDGYDAKQVAWMIRWATSDEFWRANILSMSKLREKFDQLKAKAGVGAKAAVAGFNGEIDVEAILGRDVWSPGTPPEGLDVAEEIEWKKQQRAAHKAERLEEAKRKFGVAA